MLILEHILFSGNTRKVANLNQVLSKFQLKVDSILKAKPQVAYDPERKLVDFGLHSPNMRLM